MGRWSRPLAESFVRWLDAPEAQHWLDVGTGTGALAAAICRIARPTTVMACDAAEAFVRAAKRGLSDSRVRFEVAGVGQLPARAGGYDVAVSGLALNFFPDPREAVLEQLSLLRVGGRVAACVWDYAEGMEFLRTFWDTANGVDPTAAQCDEGMRFPICRPSALRDLFESCGALDVRTDEIRIPTVFRDFDDFWDPFVGGPVPAPGYVAALSPSRRAALIAGLRKRLAERPNAPIELTARAWVVVGRCYRVLSPNLDG